ncbi:MAG: radical SAM protein [Anaerolineae bacterium]|nr:radical SAM protein [Anaerolineae bacterium]
MDCPTFPELKYSEFGQRILAEIGNKRVPLMGSFELTYRCNLRCVHCYLDDQHNGVPGLQELSFSEIRGILDQIADAGCLWLLLTGGEPLVRPDFLDIYRYAKSKGFLVTLFTNGTLLTPEIADVLAEYKPFMVEVTLYGHTQETYERVTGIPGSHARCMRGIELLQERGIQFSLKTMVLTLNQDELADMEAFAESLDVGFRFDPLVNAGMDGTHVPLTYRLSPGEIVNLDIAHPERMTEWRAFYDQHMPGFEHPGTRYVCAAGVRTFHIDPYGQLGVCVLAREPAFNLRVGTFTEGWKILGEIRFAPANSQTECYSCRLLPLCGSCPEWAQLEYGSGDGPVEFLCGVAQQRARLLEKIVDS